MADCATEADGRQARELGFAILGTTLSGYTEATARAGDGPDLELVRQFRQLGGFVMAEGRLHTPQDGRRSPSAPGPMRSRSAPR